MVVIFAFSFFYSFYYYVVFVLISFSELLLEKNGKPYKEGTIIKNEKYAMTLEIIRDYPESFYNGKLAKKISQDITKHIPDEQRKGQVTEQDLRKYKTVIRQPLKSNLAGMKMLLTPPPTSGAVLGLVLNILKGMYLVPFSVIIIIYLP